MNDRGPSQPARKIKAFLDEHRNADVVVCTGSASVKGLAWLARQVDRDRRVTIVIGDMTGQSFAIATDDDRRVAAAFLRRSNVKVHNWYRQKPVKKIAHGKAVVVLQSGNSKAAAALVGSANLTDKGLSDNLELMVRCDPGDLHEIDSYIAEATSHQPANDKLIGFVTNVKSMRFATKEEPQVAAGGGGCLPVVAMIPAQLASGLWARIKLSVFAGQ
ncbi:MAG: phospholipase D family protein [bacterium]|nr:phospholipase D family protein [bacterium]